MLSLPYKYWSYDLKIARTDERMGLSGCSLIIFYCSHPVEIRLDDIRADKIPIEACDQTNPVNITGIPFSEIWMTNPAYDGGRIDFIVLFGGSNIEILQELQKPKGLDRILNIFMKKR